MPTPMTIYENNDVAAHAVNSHLDGLRPSPQRFCLRPYNRFEPAFTVWWLVPSNDWPAYRHSKLFLCSADLPEEARRQLWAGIYVEHGLGSQLGELPGVEKTHVMDDQWYWHDFLSHAAAGDIDPTILAISQATQLPVVAHLVAYEFNAVPKLDDEPPEPHDWFEVVIHPNGTRTEHGMKPHRLFRSLSGCASAQDLAQRLAAVTHLSFFWLDLLIGVRLEYGSRDQGTWGASDIWGRALKPWNQWVH